MCVVEYSCLLVICDEPRRPRRDAPVALQLPQKLRLRPLKSTVIDSIRSFIIFLGWVRIIQHSCLVSVEQYPQIPVSSGKHISFRMSIRPRKNRNSQAGIRPQSLSQLHRSLRIWYLFRVKFFNIVCSGLSWRLCWPSLLSLHPVWHRHHRSSRH